MLITGGAGFIGSRLARDLLARGDRVIVADYLHPQVHPGRGWPADLPREVELVPLDVTVEQTWGTLLRLHAPSVVVHLAAETGTGQSLTEASRHGMVNVVGTTRMLDAFSAQGYTPEHFILASSRAVYGEGEWTAAAGGGSCNPPPRRHEDLAAGRWDPVGAEGEALVHVPARAGRTVPNPSNIYAATKLTQELVLRAWCAAMNSRLSVLRLQNVYGPGQSPTNFYTGILTLFARLASAHSSLDVYEDGLILRDFVFVGDVVTALAAAIDRPPEQSRVLDVGSGAPTTILDAAARIARIAGAPEPVVSGRFRDGDVRAASCDIEPTMQELGWQPKVGLDDGLAQLVGWMREVGE
ncbi:NAD-dependent epimerase/dehydratase family protein [Acidiferrimicrobium sp. IK]|uniref:NAD-dependent epimerase/dehydratase family protein n=1 Tax=Acidiferrimicrobium sp. IK TaxID=2871700 RepID=UPI003967C52E